MQAFILQTLLKVCNSARDFSAGFVLKKESDHEIAGGEVKRHDGFAADSTDDSVHLDPICDTVLR
jgi:hypothetical protein